MCKILRVDPVHAADAKRESVACGVHLTRVRAPRSHDVHAG